MPFVGYSEKYAAMSFHEIARRLGVTYPAVREAYVRGMRKIREDREAVEALEWMIRERQRERAETVYPEWV